MNITEIRIKLVPGKRDKLRGFASITVDDCLVIRDIKIIEGGQGIFVAMPSRKLCDRCPSCAGKNHVRARYCNDCGNKLNATRAENDERGRPRLYADVAHPIHQRARDFVQGAVLEEYRLELERSSKEGYVETTFDDLDYDYLIEHSQDDLD
jgi:stage V sporulation protein G